MNYVPRTNVIPGVMSRVSTMPGAPSTGTSEVQTMNITATSGSYKLDFGGAVTVSMPYNASIATIGTNLLNLPNIPAGGVVVGGALPTVTVTFSGELASMPVPLLKVVNSSLNVAPTITRTTPGVAATLRGAAKGALATRADTGGLYVNGGTPAAPVWTAIV